MVYRAILSIFILLVYLNKNIKMIMIDSVPKHCITPLAIRTIFGNFAIFVNFMAAKYFSLTLVAMIINCAPFVQLVFAGPLL